MKDAHDMHLRASNQQMVDGSKSLHAALWREHPRIMRTLGARPV